MKVMCVATLQAGYAPLDDNGIHDSTSTRRAAVVRTSPYRAGLVLSVIFVLFPALESHPVLAEYEVDFDAGLWIPFLPDYTAGSIVQGGVAQQRDLFRDDQTDVGVQGGLSGYVRLPKSGCRLDWDLGIAGIEGMGSTGTFADPNPGTVWLASLDGNGFIATAAGENANFSLDSDVFFNRQYLGLGDTWLIGGDRSRPIDLSIGFSHLGFEQNHNLNVAFDLGENGQYLEDLDTNYLGGEIRGSVNRQLNKHDVICEFGVGFFNMNSDYRGTSILNTGAAVFDTDTAVDEIDEFAVTIDLAVRLDTELCGVGVRPGVTFKYISDMPVINHPMTEVPLSDPVNLSTDSAYFLGVNVEVFLLDHCTCRR